jgi:hypothetical protein
LYRLLPYLFSYTHTPSLQLYTPAPLGSWPLLYTSVDPPHYCVLRPVLVSFGGEGSGVEVKE